MTVVASDLIFIHVPKTGGISISAAMGGGTKDWPKHAPASCFTKCNQPIVGTIRNPWERLASYYLWLRSQVRMKSDRGSSARARKIGFRDWLMDTEDYLGSDPVDGYWHDGKTGRWRPWREAHFNGYLSQGLPPLQKRPAAWWLNGCGMVIQYERFDEQVFDVLKLSKVQRLNAGPASKTDWRTLYDDHAAEFVAQHHAEDITIGGYDGP